MRQPKIIIKKDLLDKIVEILTFVAVLIAFLLPLLYYSALPEQIPLHFNASGIPDRIGSRHTIWLFPTLGTVLCFGINRLIKFPHIFNYPGRLTATNVEQHYKLAQKSLRFINLLIAGAIAYITYEIIFSSLGRSEGLGSGFIIIFSLLMLGTPLLFMLKMNKIKNK